MADKHGASAIEQVHYPEKFNQNDLIKENYMPVTDLPIKSEPAEQINGKAAKYDSALDKEQPMAGPN